ncbi:mechanosensitive ion channel family protein [Nocardia rhizosphaerihabitans]|uniref:Transporter (Transmembrane protein) n=1 Tax=Nocardia rhizosphaerihabitans TaxID=1691570 RepID=A0ABQ2K810_9NOCA|nr:hypothetical protein [Nocardia rhizosphaerihabitans]GGN74910.1 hypothetical protein GCM10011610_18820 [Nocardia rhizosphaerihabitans]
MNISVVAIDFQQGFTDAWSSVARFIPKLAAFIAILLVGWIIAKVVAKIVNAVLERLGFDRLVERGQVQKMLSHSKYDASDLLAKIAYYAILLIALQIGFGVFGPNPVSDLLAGIVAWLPKAAVAIVIVVIAAAIAHAVSELVTSMLGGLSYGPMLGRIAAVFIWGIGIIAALNQIGVATSVTTPILIAVLATIGGILVVGLGGGLVRPMEQRWNSWLGNLEAEMPAMRGQAEAYQRGREDAARASGQAVPGAPVETERQQVTPGASYPEAGTPGAGYPEPGRPGWGGETGR